MVDSSDLNADKHFFELSELAGMSLEELQTLWDSVPTEEQTYLVRVFEREADKRQVVEDIDESRMARHFLEQYQQTGFVPAGDVWLKVPLAVREQYKLPLVEDREEDDTGDEVSAAPKAAAGGLPKWLILLAVPFACLIIFAVMRMITGGNTSDEEMIAILPSETPSPTPTLTPTVTPTPLPPTATPFSLSGFDAAISSGERSNREYYPVQLQIFSEREMWQYPKIMECVVVSDWLKQHR
jgi:hypothetical protein